MYVQLSKWQIISKTKKKTIFFEVTILNSSQHCLCLVVIKAPLHSSVFVWKRWSVFFLRFQKKISVHNLRFWIDFARQHKNTIVSENVTLFDRSHSVGPCAFTSTRAHEVMASHFVRGIGWIQHRDVFFFYKLLRFNSSTRIEEDGVFQNLHSGEHFHPISVHGRPNWRKKSSFSSENGDQFRFQGNCPRTSPLS